MVVASVLVVGETPSLGRSIVDLLESVGVAAEYVPELSAARPLQSLRERFPIVVAACNGPSCASLRQWTSGELPGVSLVVVGGREPGVGSPAGLHWIALPVDPPAILAVVERLLREGRRRPSGSGAGP